jgi:hypothetical protein
LILFLPFPLGGTQCDPHIKIHLYFSFISHKIRTLARKSQTVGGNNTGYEMNCTTSKKFMTAKFAMTMQLSKTFAHSNKNKAESVLIQKKKTGGVSADKN